MQKEAKKTGRVAENRRLLFMSVHRKLRPHMTKNLATKYD